jgi:ribosomal protein S18 acetylase RimI-like enzyme
MVMTNRFQTRPAKWTDVHSIVDLRNSSSQSTRGTDVTAVHWQKRHWYDEEIDLCTDTLLVLIGNQVVGYVELASKAPYILYEMVGAVHPDFRDQGIGTSLVRWAENKAMQSVHKAPDDAAVFIHNSLFDSNKPGRKLLESKNFKNVRDFVYLQIKMEQKPPDPEWSDGITVRPLHSEDWEKVGPALHEAFENHWGNIEYELNKKVEDEALEKPNPEKTDPEAFNPAYFNSPGFCFVAWDGDQVVGSCLCNAMTVEFPEAGYIGSLSIRRPWRKRGIGSALTLKALNAFFERETRYVITDTDGDSLTQAYRVYQKVGMEIFRREHVYEKIIRPGTDYVKRKMIEAKQDKV